MAGIVGYGVYIPRWRIKTEEIAKVWGQDPDRIKKGLGIKEKAVGYVDENAVTIGVEATRNALGHAQLEGNKIESLFIGSESHPYAVKPSASTIVEAIGAVPNVMAADLEFACKAGTAAIQMDMGYVNSGMIKYGVAIGADTAQGRPGDALEYSAGSGGASYIIGRDNESIATIKDTVSYTTDTPDFWRRPKADYPSHGGRFTGEPAYFKHILGATNLLLDKTGMKLDNFDYVVFHQPNVKFPLAAARKLKIPKEKLLPGIVTDMIGNTYSGCMMLGLAKVLDIAKPGQKILATSFGSGAGGDSFYLEVTDKIDEKRKRLKTVQSYIDEKEHIDYATYIKFRKKIKK